METLETSLDPTLDLTRINVSWRVRHLCETNTLYPYLQHSESAMEGCMVHHSPPSPPHFLLVHGHTHSQQHLEHATLPVHGSQVGTGIACRRSEGRGRGCSWVEILNEDLWLWELIQWTWTHKLNLERVFEFLKSSGDTVSSYNLWVIIVQQFWKATFTKKHTSLIYGWEIHFGWAEDLVERYCIIDKLVPIYRYSAAGISTSWYLYTDILQQGYH